MIKNKQFKKGNSGPGPLIVIVILILVVVAIFFLSNYLVGFVPNDLENPGGDGLDTTDEEVVEANIDIKTLSQGVYSGYNESGGLIIDNENNFKTLWAQTTGGQAPDVDFDSKVVLAAFAGDKPTGGYSIQISEVVLDDEKITANITLITPGRNCAVASSITNPYHIISIDKQEMPIEFVSYDEVEDCD
jgi:hypothetical protein